MNVVWILAIVGSIGAVAKQAAWAYKRHRPAELGFVSQQWLAEYRLSETSDARQ